MAERSVTPYSNVGEMGLALREARLRTGLSQRKVAQAADVTQNWLLTIEAGRVSGADTSRLIRIADVLGCTFALLGPADETAGE